MSINAYLNISALEGYFFYRALVTVFDTNRLSMLLHYLLGYLVPLVRISLLPHLYLYLPGYSGHHPHNRTSHRGEPLPQDGRRPGMHYHFDCGGHDCDLRLLPASFPLPTSPLW